MPCRTCPWASTSRSSIRRSAGPGGGAAAHLAAGVPIEELGPAVEPGTVVRLDLPQPSVGERHIRATVLDVDRFGNIQLNVRRARPPAPRRPRRGVARARRVL